MKYINLVDNKLIENKYDFVIQLINIRHSDLSFSCLCSIVTVITECINKEWYKIDVNIAEAKERFPANKITSEKSA